MTQMHRVKEYQLVDNMVTFNHHHSFKIGPKDVQTTSFCLFHEQFSTVFEGNMLGWDLHLHRDPIDLPWRIELLQTAIRHECPPAQKIQFTLNVMNSDGTVKRSLKYVIDGQTDEGRIATDLNTFQTDPNSKFGKDLLKLMASADKKEHKLELQTKWVYDRDDFADSKYLLEEGAPIETEASKRNFDLITEKFQQNLKLITSDGTQFVMTNNEIVCLTSEHFRELLTEHTTELTVESSNVDAINICLIYMVTGRFKKPAQLTPRLASEIFALAQQWLNHFDLKKLKNSLETHLCQELQKNHEDLPYVCNLMIIAEDDEYANVKLCCIATIVSYHAHDFIRAMVNSRHPLSERLSTREEQQHESLADQVIDAYYQSLKAKSCINVISDE